MESTSNDRKEVALLEWHFQDAYAKALLAVVPQDAKKPVGASTKWYRYITCCRPAKCEDQLKFTVGQIRECFDEMMQMVDEEDILQNWTEAVSHLYEISHELKAIYSLKIYCKDWRETGMKTTQWKEYMIDAVVRLQESER